METLHVPNQLFPQFVCQKSSKANIFEGKGASEAKSDETKKHKFHEMLDLITSIQKTMSQDDCRKLRLSIFFS